MVFMAKRFAGRPVGAANKSTGFLRKQSLQLMVSDGFAEVLRYLVEVSPEGTSRTDLLHEALRDFSYKKLTEAKHLRAVKKIM